MYLIVCAQKISQIPLRAILFESQNKTFIRLNCIYISVFTTVLNLKCVLQIKHIAKKYMQGLSKHMGCRSMGCRRHCMYKTAVEENPTYPILYKSL